MTSYCTKCGVRCTSRTLKVISSYNTNRSGQMEKLCNDCYIAKAKKQQDASRNEPQDDIL
jgi:hypothetical protein